MLTLHLVVFVMFVATDDTAAVRDDLMAACQMHGLSDKEIADHLGIGRGQFAGQKSLQQHLSLWRLKRLPMCVQVDFWKLHGKRIGLTVIEDAQLGEYLAERLARFQKRRQVKMALTDTSARKGVA
jgi:hypothetical protein